MSIFNRARKSQAREIIRRCITTNGCTYSPERGFPTEGYAVALYKTDYIIPVLTEADVIRILEDTKFLDGEYLGVWKRPDGRWEVNVTMVYDDVHEALADAKIEKQRSIYNLATDTTISLFRGGSK